MHLQLFQAGGHDSIIQVVAILQVRFQKLFLEALVEDPHGVIASVHLSGESCTICLKTLRASGPHHPAFHRCDVVHLRVVGLQELLSCGHWHPLLYSVRRRRACTDRPVLTFCLITAVGDHFDVVDELLLGHLEQVVFLSIPLFLLLLLLLSDLVILLEQHGCMLLILSSSAEELARFVGLLVQNRHSLIITTPSELLIESGVLSGLLLLQSLHDHLTRRKWILPIRSSKLLSPVLRLFFLSLQSNHHLLL